jgi:hypothetical protein
LDEGVANVSVDTSDHYKKNPLRYKLYHWNCGRDVRLTQVWGRER